MDALAPMPTTSAHAVTGAAATIITGLIVWLIIAVFVKANRTPTAGAI